MSSLGPGSTLLDGRYRLDELIGRGGMAIVWRATDLQLERTVAIKVISDVLASDPRFVARFEREARLAAGLNHPNLVKLFDFSIDTERPFLIMEYVSGGTLAEARGRTLNADALARELLDAVAHIHGAGILHRDIKPANVLLGAEGSPRLTDFGIARGEDTVGLTQTGQIMGTLRYIAPEVAAGHPSTPRSDLFSLGVMLSEIAGPSSSQALHALIARLAAADPRDRPASAAHALAELEPTRQLDPTVKTVALDISQPTVPLHADRSPEAPGAASSDDSAFRMPRSRALGAAGALIAVLVLVVIAASGGGHSKLDVKTTPSLSPAPAGAPAAQQIDRLEQIVRAAPRKP